MKPSNVHGAVGVGLSPEGVVSLRPDPGGEPLPMRVAARIQAAFEQGAASGLLHLGLVEVDTALPPSLAFFRSFARGVPTSLCGIPEAEEQRAALDLPPPANLRGFLEGAPPFVGAEYLQEGTLAELWTAMVRELQTQLAAFEGTVEAYLHSKSAHWNTVGRIHLHLAENKRNPEVPFAFLATYVARLSAAGKAQHQPLGQALREYAGAKNRQSLLALLTPLQRASKVSALIRELVETNRVYQPLGWGPREAHRFLQEIPALESAGLVVKLPDWWKSRRPPRPNVSVNVGKAASTLGTDQILDFSVEMVLEGEKLSADEQRQILSASEGLVLLRGKWVEVDRHKLGAALSHWKEIERAVSVGGLSFGEGMRLVAGLEPASSAEEPPEPEVAEWARVQAGPWMLDALERIRDPAHTNQVEPGALLHATLRPYQDHGLRWLWTLGELNLGACLADDMGLGKTIQVIALLLALKRQKAVGPHLLVVPASLIANWQAEVERFAPSLQLLIAHPSGLPGAQLADLDVAKLEDIDAVITTYATLYRVPGLANAQWGVVVLDEAQNIKNPGAKQTRAVKQLKARNRIALTGTPVENRLGDLWSLFDFLNPGLLGDSKRFTQLTRTMAKAGPEAYAPLRALVRPYILRRLKSDKTIISDLPDKTEVNAWCTLTKLQAVLYKQAVDELRTGLEAADGIQRLGIVLASLMRFKQICNHPDQWLGQEEFSPDSSGKFSRLRELCEEISERQEKVLVFTQFAQLAPHLARFLTTLFGREGLVLTGETAIRERQKRVDRFQSDPAVPFFVLSVKAGGTGLNLTAASHVIHFDRWWNPAVENQATDRAYRIGQKRSVLVHKFVCRGTVEERIDELIQSKRALADSLLSGAAEVNLTELGNEELLRLVSLDLGKATEL